MTGQFRQSVFGRLGGYEDVNDADRLGRDPAIFEALKLDTHIDEIARQAASLKNLQDSFRQAATVTALGPFEEFQSQFIRLMDRMDDARATSITPPERCFKAAQKKIDAGHYDFVVDFHAGTPGSNGG